MITIEPNFIYVTCTNRQAKQMDAVWVKSKRMWRVPNTLGALRELHKLGFDVTEYGKQKAEQRKQMLSAKDAPIGIFDFGSKLRPYQIQDINFLSSIPHCGVFSEMRTGEQI